MTTRHPIKKHCFEKIKELGIPINTILDVGVQTGTLELMEAFPDKPHLLFEPIADWYPKIREYYSKQNISFQLHELALSDRDGQIRLQTDSVNKNLPVTHARIASSTAVGNFREVPTRRLDTLIPEFSPLGPFLLKIDVDGAEIEILSGAHGILQQCNIVVVECGMRNIMERSSIVLNAGFSFFDIVDLVYYDNRLRQLDLVFINNATMDQMGLDMWKQPFDIQKWRAYNPWVTVKDESPKPQQSVKPFSFKQRMDLRLAHWYGGKQASAALSQEMADKLQSVNASLTSLELERRKYIASLVNKSVMEVYAKKNSIPLPRRFAETANPDELNFYEYPDRIVVKPNNSADSDCVLLFHGDTEIFSKAKVAKGERKNFVLEALKKGRFINAQTKVIVEEYIEDYDGQFVIPRDFKVYVAGGTAHLIQVINRNGPKASWSQSFYYRDWMPLADHFQTTYQPGPSIPEPPFLKELLHLADKIAADIRCFMRLDFFVSKSGVIFGEFTSYPFGGLKYTPFGDDFLCRLMDKHPDDFKVDAIAPNSQPAKPPSDYPVSSKPNVLARLRKFLPISAIVDVGVRECTGELIQVFPDKHHYLFEPVGLFQPVIEKHYAALPHTLIPLALSDADATLYLIQSSLERDKRITHSQISPTPKECDGHTILSCDPFVVRRFDSLELATNIENNFLLKVDVDGKDLEVLQGFGPHLQKASAVIIECTMETLIKRVGYLESQGFRLIDLVDIVHYGPALYQLDAVLVRKDLITKELKPNISEFQRELWRAAKVS